MPVVTFTASGDEASARRTADLLDGPLEEEGIAYALFDCRNGRWEMTIHPPEGRAEAARDLLERISVELTFERQDIPDENWVQRSLEGLKPVRAGRFLVHGSHDRGAVRVSDIAIEIEAGEAFGTGHHATTTGCLLAIERLLKRMRPRNVLDLGTGSGVLAIALAKRTDARILATDIDPASVRTAWANARINGVAPKVVVSRADGLAHPTIRHHAPFDLIVANILAEPLRGLAPTVSHALGRGGTVILSGLLDRQARTVLNAYRRYGLEPTGTISLDGWSTLTLSRSSRSLG